MVKKMRKGCLIALLWLMALAVGCSRAPLADARLVRADSLMLARPDSALAIVEGIAPAALPGEGDRAYRELLLAQARYRCYVTATADSGINRALHYYTRHSDDRDKLTRAHLYKGAVMEELGHPDSAMRHYKAAEAAADPNDHFNLGYANLRIAELYLGHHSKDSAVFVSLKKAVRNFEQSNDTNLLITSCGYMGAYLAIKSLDSAEYYLSKAIRLCQSHFPDRQYTYKSKLAGYHYYCSKDYPQANRLAMDVLHNGAEMCDENQFYYYAAMSYLKMGKTDSAKLIARQTPPPACMVDSMNLFDVLAEIAKVEGRKGDYATYANQSKDLLLQIKSEDNEACLVKNDRLFDTLQAEKREKQATRRGLMLALALVIVALLAIILALGFNRLHRRSIKNEKEWQRVENELKSSIDELTAKIRFFESTNQSASQLVSYRVEALNELFNTLKFRLKEDSGKKRSVVPLPGLIKDLDRHYEMLKVKMSDSFWKKFRLSVDGEYNGIVSFVEQNYPKLSDTDIKMFCLLCSGISPQIIKLCMNYTNINSVTNYRTIIIKKKMGLDMTFDEFVEKYMKNTLN